MIRTGGKELKSPEEVREHVLSLPRRERYYFLEKYNTMLDKVSEKVMDIREDIIEQIEADNLWEGHVTRREYQKAWQPTIEAVREHQEKKARIESAKSAIKRQWGTTVFERAFANMSWPYSQWDAVRHLSIKCRDFGTAGRLLLSAYYGRMEARTRGQRSSKELLGSDWRKATDIFKQHDWKNKIVDDETLKNHADTGPLFRLFLDVKGQIEEEESLDPMSSPILPSPPGPTVASSQVTQSQASTPTPRRSGFEIRIHPRHYESSPVTGQTTEGTSTPEKTPSELRGPGPGVHLSPISDVQEPVNRCGRCINIPNALIERIDTENKAISPLMEVVGQVLEIERSAPDAQVCFRHRKLLAGTCGF